VYVWRCLTRILSRDTPTVCLTVETVVLSGCWRLSDRGLRTVARRCTELRRLEMSYCQRVSNVALFDVISRCVSLSHLDVTGTCRRRQLLFYNTWTILYTAAAAAAAAAVLVVVLVASRPTRFRVQPWASCSHTCTSVTKQYNLVPA